MRLAKPASRRLKFWRERPIALLSGPTTHERKPCPLTLSKWTTRSRRSRLKTFFRGLLAMPHFHQYISGIDQESAISTQVLAAVKAGDSAQTKALSDKGSALNSTDDARAKALGFAQCARNVQPAG